MTMGFVQSDSVFNTRLWDGGIGDATQKYLIGTGVDVINEPIDIPVDP